MSLQEHLERFGVPTRYAKLARGRLGYGTEGAVYDLGGGKVLKVNVVSNHQAITKVAKRANRYSWTARTFDSGKLHPEGMRPRGFWYVSEKLYPLTEREQRLLNTVGLAEIVRVKRVVRPGVANALSGAAMSSLPAELVRVVRLALKAGYRDIHGRNIMRTESGTYKVIDVESLRPVK